MDSGTLYALFGVFLYLGLPIIIIFIIVTIVKVINEKKERMQQELKEKERKKEEDKIKHWRETNEKRAEEASVKYFSNPVAIKAAEFATDTFVKELKRLNYDKRKTQDSYSYFIKAGLLGDCSGVQQGRIWGEYDRGTIECKRNGHVFSDAYIIKFHEEGLKNIDSQDEMYGFVYAVAEMIYKKVKELHPKDVTGTQYTLTKEYSFEGTGYDKPCTIYVDFKYSAPNGNYEDYKSW